MLMTLGHSKSFPLIVQEYFSHLTLNEFKTIKVWLKKQCFDDSI